MTHTANHAVPEPGKFRRALAAVWAFLQAMESTSFDYTLDRIETPGAGGGTTEGGAAPKPRSGGHRYPQRALGPLLWSGKAFRPPSCKARKTSMHEVAARGREPRGR